jgi:hypothetical protein
VKMGYRERHRRAPRIPVHPSMGTDNMKHGQLSENISDI